MFTYLHAYGILPKNAFVERNGLEMKGKYVGHTAPTVKEAIAEAMGGCLFLDEAYALADSQDGFSGEAVRTLLTEVENNRTALMVVLAGYADKMENLMRADPGLPRRFPNDIHLDDYTAAELAQIAKKVAEEKFALVWEDGLEVRLAFHILERHASDIAAQNGGLAVNLVERALSNFASRIVADGHENPETARTMRASDFGIVKPSRHVSFDVNEASEDTLTSAHEMAEGGADADTGADDILDLEVEEFRRALSLPVSKDELRRTISTPAEGRKARHQAYAVPAKMAEHFGGRATFTSSAEWLRGTGKDSRTARGQDDVEPFSITEVAPEMEPELEPTPEDTSVLQIRAENRALKEEMATMIEELHALRRQVREEE